MGSTAAMLLRSVAVLALLAMSATTAAAQYWNSGTATFYGGRDGSGTMGTLPSMYAAFALQQLRT
jgi:hypothetical protein